jgi:hypothetical protein
MIEGAAAPPVPVPLLEDPPPAPVVVLVELVPIELVPVEVVEIAVAPPPEPWDAPPLHAARAAAKRPA